MERLHQAIQKAREQRGNTMPPRLKLPKTAPPLPSAQAAWTKLSALKLRTRTLQKKRIVTLDAGPEAAPYDLLRTRVLQKTREHGWRRVAVVSPHSRCGKTTVTANLAFSLARHFDIRSIAFDFDLRRRGLSELLRQKLEHGMADVLEGDVEFADHALRYTENVAFGLNGYAIRAAAEILQSPGTSAVLNLIQETYQPNLMLFDMPPLNASDDNFGFLQNVDCAIIVIAAEKTTMSQIDVAERQVAELTNVVGTVLNQCRYAGGAYGHDYENY